MIEVYCKRIKFYDSVPFERMSYINRNYEDVEAYEAKTLLSDVIDISEVKYDQAKVLSGEALELVKKCGTLTITLGTNFNNNFDYFNIKSDEKKYLYVFWVRFDTYTVFTGAVLQDGIKYKEEPAETSERITIEIPSLLNHFLSYMQSKVCNLSEVEYLFTRTFEISGSEYRSSYLADFLRKIFFDNHADFTVSNETGKAWEINRQPFFFVNADNQYQFLTNGFRKISAPGVLGQFESKTGFFTKLCNAMGWDFALTSDFSTEKITLSIRNRARIPIAVAVQEEDLHTINYDTKLNDAAVEYIVIKDGFIDAGSAYGSQVGFNQLTLPKGIPVKIISEDGSYSNNGYFFKYATNSSGYYKLWYWENAEYYMVANSLGDGNRLEYAKVSYSGNTRVVTSMNIDNKNILFVDGGENTLPTVVDMASKIITLDKESRGESTADVLFKGNYGSMLFYRENNYIRNYDYYSKTGTFTENFKTLLKNKNSDVIEIKLNRLLNDYYNSDYRQVRIYSDDTYLNDTWDITELGLDLINETSTLKLKKPL